MATSFERFRSAVSERYDLDRELGAGGMATVYLATDRKHHRRVALKVLRPEVAESIGMARFLREIEIAARLAHPNILSLHDSGDADGLLFYVMPYVDGRSLRDRLRTDGPLPLLEAVRVVGEIADAPQYAHANGVLHRDIKPENILLESNHAVVTDFGIARAIAVSGDDSITTTGLGIGTTAYMSPEQVVGERNIDARCDVYGLGCVAFEMLTNRRAFDAPTSQGVIAAKLVGPSPRMCVINPRIPAAVDRVVQKAIAPSPDDRYSSAEQFASALRQAVAGAAPARNPVSKRLAPIATLGVVVALVAAEVVWRSARAMPPVRALAVLPFTGAPASLPVEIVDGLHDEIIGELGRLPSLRVISRTSVMRFRDRTITIPTIARELGVDAVVEGALYATADSIRIQVRLVRVAPEERQIWTQSYSRDRQSLMTLRSDVARDIAGQLRSALSGDARVSTAVASAPQRRTDPAAFELYLRGRYWLNRRTAEGLTKSQAALRQAIGLDDQFAAAHAALAEELAMAVDWHYDRLDPIATSRAAIEEANRAIALDSTNADAFAARGRVLSATHAPEAATRGDFERALRLAPQHANAHGWFGMDLAWRGRVAESRAQNDTAIDLDGLAPGRHMGFALSALNNDEPEVALQHARVALSFEPSLEAPRSVEALALLLLGRASECVHLALERYVAIRALCLHTLGRRDEARHLIDSIAARVDAANRNNGPYADLVLGENLALYYAWIGDARATITWLRRAGEITTASAPFLYINSKVFAPVRDDPAFVSGVEQLKRETWQRVNTPPIPIDAPDSVRSP